MKLLKFSCYLFVLQILAPGCFDPPVPAALDFMTYDGSPGLFPILSTVNYTCNAAYRWSSNTTVDEFSILCQIDGLWSMTSLSPCIRKTIISYCTPTRTKKVSTIDAESNCNTDPPTPHSNGGMYDWNTALTGASPFMTQVTYSCDKGRRLKNIDGSPAGYTILQSRTISCQWDGTWSDSVVN